MNKYITLVALGLMAALFSGCGYEAISLKTEYERKGYRMDYNPRVRGWSSPSSLSWYCYGSTTHCNEVGSAAVEWSNETLMNLSRATSSSYDPNKTNIRYAVSDYGDTGYSGVAFSGDRGGVSEWSSRGCIKQYGCRLASARTNLYYSFVRNSSTARRGIACQELGHLFGLGHSPGDCMGYTYFKEAHSNVDKHSVDGIGLLRYLEGVYGI